MRTLWIPCVSLLLACSSPADGGNTGEAGSESEPDTASSSGESGSSTGSDDETAGGSAPGDDGSGPDSETGDDGDGDPSGDGDGDTGEPPGPGVFEPPDGRTMLIVGQNKPPMQEYVDMADRVPAGFMTYTNLSFLTGFDEPLDRMEFGYWPRTQDDIVMQVGMWMTGNDATNEELLLGTLEGRYDDNLDSLARHFAEADVPVFLRVGYEVNGRFPPTYYADAFRHVRDRIENVNGVTNVAYVWHVTPGFTRTGTSNHMEWYPGDDVVDWIGISWFVDVVGGGNTPPETLDIVLGNLDAISTYAKDHQKPLMVAEAAPMKEYEPTLGQASWDLWYAPLFEYIERYDVKALSYINQRWVDFGWEEDLWGDSRVQTDETVSRLWFETVYGDRYLHAGPELYQAIGY